MTSSIRKRIQRIERKIYRFRMFLRRVPLFTSLKNILYTIAAITVVVALVPLFIAVIEFIWRIWVVFQVGSADDFEIGDYETLLVALVALVGVLLGLRNAQKERKKESATKILLETRTSEFFQKQTDIFEKNFPVGNKVCAEDYITKTKDPKAKKAVGVIFNFYEFLASGIRNGLFEKDIVRDNVRGIICSLVYDMQDVIASIRKNDVSGTALENLIAVYLAWADRDATLDNNPNSPEWDDEVEAKLTAPVNKNRKKSTP